jgi:hypothetical protein
MPERRNAANDAVARVGGAGYGSGPLLRPDRILLLAVR